MCPENSIESIKLQYDNIECLAEEHGKKGIYAALNHGFRTYGHEFKYLTFINDDDHWVDNYQLLIDYISCHREVDMVYAKTFYVDEQYNKIGSQTSFPLLRLFLPLLKKRVVMLTQQATLITSKLYFEIGGFDETYRLAADTKFWALTSIKNNIKTHYINKACAAYMIQEGQLSSDHDRQEIEHMRLFNEISVPRFNPNLALVLFRIYNLPIYLKRLIFGKVRNPFIA